MVPERRGIAIYLAVMLLAGCEASPAPGPASSGYSEADHFSESGDYLTDDMIAYRKSLPPVPESLKPFVAELGEVTRKAKPQNERKVPTSVLPGLFRYQMADGGKLIAVDLSFTPVTDEFLKKLNALPDLEKINLTDTNITDAGLENLGDMPSLKELVLWSTKVTDDGAAKFREAHPNCTVHGPAQSK
jgi:hypothetical protein